MKIAATLTLLVLSIQAFGQSCDLTVMGKKFKLEHIYIFEQANWMKPEKMDWVVFCIEEVLSTEQQSAEKINRGLSMQDFHGVKIIIEPKTQRITEVKLNWHDFTIAMISGILSTVEFNGDVGENHLKGEIKSLEHLTAQKSAVVNEEMITENIEWFFSVTLNHTVTQAALTADPK